MREIAMKHYHGEEGFNCCQAILKTFQEGSHITDEHIIGEKRSGGGRAPGNLCGALYALHQLEPEHRDRFTKNFIEKVGSSKCREIRGQKLLSCRECTGVAADIMTEHRKN